MFAENKQLDGWYKKCSWNIWDKSGGGELGNQINSGGGEE